MNTQTFWSVIAEYNKDTIVIQLVLLMFVVAGLFFSYSGKIKWLAKTTLGVSNLFIGIVFFGIYGTEPIQKFFALPLYLLCGVLFLYEGICNREESLKKPNYWQVILLALYIVYPMVSLLLGNHFPSMVTYIMPCPIISLSIVVYSGYEKKNKLLLVLLTIWGVTGVKSVIFNAYEDVILLICGVYGLVLSMSEFRKSKGANH